MYRQPLGSTARLSFLDFSFECFSIRFNGANWQALTSLPAGMNFLVHDFVLPGVFVVVACRALTAIRCFLC